MREKFSISFIATRFGFALLGWQDRIETFILPQKTREQALTWLLRYGFSTQIPEEDIPPFPGIVERIQAYFEGENVAFPYPLALKHSSPFTRRVLEEVAQIPYGTTVTYGDIAQRIVYPQAARAVGRAIGKNPIPLLIPCHRVVGRSNLGGFSGYGLRYKILLLSLEFSRSGLHWKGAL